MYDPRFFADESTKKSTRIEISILIRRLEAKRMFRKRVNLIETDRTNDWFNSSPRFLAWIRVRSNVSVSSFLLIEINSNRMEKLREPLTNKRASSDRTRILLHNYYVKPCYITRQISVDQIFSYKFQSLSYLSSRGKFKFMARQVKIRGVGED